jgi:hypothetical protein
VIVWNFRQTDIHTYGLHIPWTYHQNFSARGQQRTSERTLYKHFTVTLQRNVGGGHVWHARGKGWLEAQGQYRTSSMCLARNDKGWLCRLPRHTFSARFTHFVFTESTWWAFLMVIAAWGKRDTPAPLHLDRSLIARPNRA